jgi:hypothetical protein
MYKERNHIKVFVSSTVYDFESQLDMVYSTLDGYGYDVMMSHKGTIPLDSKLSNLENCLKGVEDCDVFLGFVRPLTGTGILKPGEKSITAQEFEVAFKVNMPRFVLADYRVVFARQFTNLMKIPTGDIPNSVKRERSDGSVVERPNRVVRAECISCIMLPFRIILYLKAGRVTGCKTICNIGIIRFPIRQPKTTCNRW